MNLRAVGTAVQRSVVLVLVLTTAGTTAAAGAAASSNDKQYRRPGYEMPCRFSPVHCVSDLIGALRIFIRGDGFEDAGPGVKPNPHTLCRANLALEKGSTETKVIISKI